MQGSFQVLTNAQVESFLTRGHVILRDCFAPEAAQTLTDRAWVRLGYDPRNPATWTETRIHMPVVERLDVRTWAPKVWDAVCELLGGEARVQQPVTWGDGFIVNLGIGADRPWEAPSPQVKGWHKDGDWFVHFLDSPEQGLLTIVVWSDIQPRGGGTFIACDSVPIVARFMAEHPEGVRPGGFPFGEMISQCHDFVEVTGKVGDVVLLHPYVLHTVSQNHLGVPRFITNPAVSLREPMRFDRPDPDDFSLVERAILQGLNVEHLDFQATTSRERITPERVRRQQQMLEAEKTRLAAAGTHA